MRPRSPVGVQEWVASLPIPSSQHFDFESIPSEQRTTTRNETSDIYCANKETSWDEALNYQDKHMQDDKVKFIDPGYLI